MAFLCGKNISYDNANAASIVSKTEVELMQAELNIASFDSRYNNDAHVAQSRNEE